MHWGMSGIILVLFHHLVFVLLSFLLRFSHKFTIFILYFDGLQQKSQIVDHNFLFHFCIANGHVNPWKKFHEVPPSTLNRIIRSSLPQVFMMWSGCTETPQHGQHSTSQVKNFRSRFHANRNEVHLSTDLCFLFQVVCICVL